MKLYLEKSNYFIVFISLLLPQNPQWLKKYHQVNDDNKQIYIVSKNNNDIRMINTK